MVGIQEPLWRAIAVFRFASIAYAAILVLINRADYSHFAWAWAVIAVMTVWTAVTTYVYSQPSRRGPLPLTVDTAVAAALLLSTTALQTPESAPTARKCPR